MITLPPNSPADIESYEDWKTFVSDYQLRVEFDRGINQPYEAILTSARYLLTTSITEGFGFSFLEPWLFDKLVWGRKLPDICTDFEANGVNLDHMYTQLNVPLDWIESGAFFEKWNRTIQNICKLLGLKIDKKRIQNAYVAITANKTIDFGLLDEEFQKQVIKGLISDKSFREKLLRLNPTLAKIGKISDKKDIIKSNCEAVARRYNMGQYRKKLLKIYAQVNRTCIRQHIDKKALLDEFLDLTKFSLLKWGDYGT